MKAIKRVQHLIACQSRFLSTESPDISSVIKRLPRISGSGPFPAEPEISVIGTPGSALYVALPASASIYTRRGRIIALNGSISDVTSKLAVNQSVKALSLAVPVLYQKITSTTPISVILSADQKDSCYKIVKVNSDNEWIITQRDSVMTWNESVTINPTSRRFADWSHVTASGSGDVALVGQGEIFEIELQQGESMLINPNSILAYSTTAAEGRIGHVQRIPHLNISFDVPQLSSRIAELKIVQTTSTWIKYAVSKLWKDDIAFKLQGPRTVLVQSVPTNRGSSNRLFTQGELKDIVRN